jgi:uncharacterized protein YjbI with pentapeptide repeats
MSPARACASFCCIAVVLLAVAMRTAEANNPCPAATHSGQNFSGQDLKDRNFANQNLTGANFSNSQLQGAVFTGANLTSADFSSADMGTSITSQRATSFSRANLNNACFNAAGLSNSDFQFADLSCTVFDNTDLGLAVFGPIIRPAAPGGSCRTSFAGAAMNCEFIPQWKDLELGRAIVQACYARMSGIDFSDGRMEGVVFSGINLNSTRWERAQLKGAFFLNSRLKDAVMSGADLRRAQMSQMDATGARLDNQTRLSGAHLSGAVLKGVDLTSAVLQAADGYPAADLSLVFMPDAVLTDAKLTGVNMSHANFYGASAKADNATMQQMDFTNANLGSLNLSQGRLRGAKLDAADLVNAVLVGADLTPTTDQISSSLVQANLQGADLTAAKLGGANLSNAAVSLPDGVVLFTAPSSLVADLNRRELSAEVISAFTGAGQHLIDCTDPSVFVDQAGSKWQIWLSSRVGPSPDRFDKFALTRKSAGIEVSGLSLVAPKVLFTVSSNFADTLDKRQLASGLLGEFRTKAYPLPPCYNPSIAVKTEGSRWTLGESLNLITVAGIGYTGFNLVLEDNAIQAYGSEVTIIRRDTGGSLTLVPIPLQPTKLVGDAFDDFTTCPNQKSYGANKASGATWKQMMTSVSPPPPPACIPSPSTWCN